MTDVERVDFIAVPTRDQGRAVRFYEETLGLERNPNSSDRWVEFETGNLTIAIMQSDAFGQEFRRHGAPIALHVDDVAAARAELEAKGVKFHADTIDSGVCLMAIFSDPDGNALMFHNRYAPKDAKPGQA
jgi:predicted enzyme related to lactoylglutathione lyase